MEHEKAKQQLDILGNPDIYIRLVTVTTTTTTINTVTFTTTTTTSNTAVTGNSEASEIKSIDKTVSAIKKSSEARLENIITLINKIS